MKWSQLSKSLHQPIKMIPDFSNATLPWSDWYLTLIHRAGGYVLFTNPATGYRLPVTPHELIGYDHLPTGVPCFRLRVGVQFECPNAFYVYRDKQVRNVTSVLNRS